MAFRFVHTADIHLDSPLRSLSLRDPRIADLIGNATRQTFEKIVALCLEEKVDALMIAGDLYDGDLRSMKTAAFFSTQMRRLTEAGIRVFIVRGNHDAESKITKQLLLPEGVHVFAGRGEAVSIDEAQVVVHGVSFAKPRAPQSLLPKYKAPVPGRVNIGLLHTSLSGAEGHDTYAPCSLRELKEHGYRYWGLGHVHKRAVHIDDEDCTVVMPGIPQGRDINESGPRSVTLVSVEATGELAVEERVVSIAQFERIAVDVSELQSMNGYRSLIREALEQARELCASDYLVARVELVGSSSLSWVMRRDADLLLEESREEAEHLRGCFVESLRLHASMPKTLDQDSSGSFRLEDAERESEGPLLELHRLLREEVFQDAAFRHACLETIRDLQVQLPSEIRDVLGRSEEELNKYCDAILREGSEDIVAQISGGSRVAGDSYRGASSTDSSQNQRKRRAS